MTQLKEKSEDAKKSKNLKNLKVSDLARIPLSDVRCPNIVITNKGRRIRCNYLAMKLRFGIGTTVCRNCGNLFTFDHNTTYLKFDQGSIDNEPFDILE